MPLSFSTQDHSSLFGVGFNPNTHLERLQAAQCFYLVRKEMEKKKTRLAMLTARDFKKHASSFQGCVAKAVKEGPDNRHRSLLLPLVQDSDAVDGVRHFILACLTLSDGHCESLAKAGLMSIFPQLFTGIVGPIIIPTETMTAVITAIEEVCAKFTSPSSKKLLG